jgi:hypothetical protein
VKRLDKYTTIVYTDDMKPKRFSGQISLSISLADWTRLMQLASERVIPAAELMRAALAVLVAQWRASNERERKEVIHKIEQDKPLPLYGYGYMVTFAMRPGQREVLGEIRSGGVIQSDAIRYSLNQYLQGVSNEQQ